MKQATIGTVFIGKYANSHNSFIRRGKFFDQDKSFFRQASERLYATATIVAGHQVSKSASNAAFRIGEGSAQNFPKTSGQSI